MTLEERMKERYREQIIQDAVEAIKAKRRYDTIGYIVALKHVEQSAEDLLVWVNDD